MATTRGHQIIGEIVKLSLRDRILVAIATLSGAATIALVLVFVLAITGNLGAHTVVKTVASAPAAPKPAPKLAPVKAPAPAAYVVYRDDSNPDIPILTYACASGAEAVTLPVPGTRSYPNGTFIKVTSRQHEYDPAPVHVSMKVGPGQTLLSVLVDPQAHRQYPDTYSMGVFTPHTLSRGSLAFTLEPADYNDNQTSLGLATLTFCLQTA